MGWGWGGAGVSQTNKGVEPRSSGTNITAVGLLDKADGVNIENTSTDVTENTTGGKVDDSKQVKAKTEVDDDKLVTVKNEVDDDKLVTAKNEADEDKKVTSKEDVDDNKQVTVKETVGSVYIESNTGTTEPIVTSEDVDWSKKSETEALKKNSKETTISSV